MKRRGRNLTFDQLIQRFGDAQFDCGAWTKDSTESYEAVCTRATLARETLVRALRKAGLNPDTVAAI